MVDTPLIRKVQPTDMAALVALCSLHAAFERAAYDPTGKAEALSEHLFAPTPSLFCLVVEHAGDLVGYTSYTRQFSTWDATHYIYMDCLYLREEMRGFGIGEQLVNHIRIEARKMGCTLIQWQTPDFNTRAMKFYDRIGGQAKAKVRYFLPLED